MNQRYKLEQDCQLYTFSLISVARVSFLLSSEEHSQENKKHVLLYLKKGMYLDTHDHLIIYLEETNLFCFFAWKCVQTNSILFSCL